MISKENKPIRAPESWSTERNLLAAGAALSPEVMDRYLARGRRLRSEAYLHVVTTLGRGALGLARRVWAAHRRWLAVRRAEQELRALDPHLLRDIGIEGHQIPALVRGLDDKPAHALRAAAQVRPLPATNAGDGFDAGDYRVDRAA